MPAVRGDSMRGLAVFISDIRNCKSKEAEIKRINKELANIRSKFKGDKTLDGYQKKKYVCKLLFIFLLGHDIDFGHMEAVNLLSSNKYSEKQIGYLFISVLVNTNSDLIKLIIQSIKNDLQSRNPIHVNLAMQCIANIGSKEMAEAFGHDIPKLLVSGDTMDVVKQSAALCNQLGQFLSNRETNLRYLALESMCSLANSELSHEAVKKHQEVVILSMKMEKDVSVRQQAVDLLYAMCDKSNAEDIVQEMLNYLETADYSIREEMVLKVAILAEKYATDFTWYVDVILNLIRIAGDYVSEEVWYRVIQIVINRDEVQGYAAKTVFEALQAPACHENMVKVGGYILGEFGNLIAGDSRSAPLVQFQLLHSKYHLCSPMTRALLLSTYVKFVNLFPEVKTTVQEVFMQHSNLRSADAELQQRASEYLKLSQIVSTDVLATVLEEMPAFPERESSILAVLKKKKPGRVPENEIRESRSPAVGGTNHSPAPVSQTNSTVNNSSAADLLGLATPPSSNNTGVLVDVLGDLYGGGAPSSTSPQPSSQSYNPKKFICKNNGVLFESELIQIGVKCEFRQNLGRLGLFYGNKTQVPLTNFSVVLSNPVDWLNKMNTQIKPIEPILEAGAQIQQLVNAECIDDYTDAPSLSISFVYNGVVQKIQMKLPLTMNKFFEPTEMNADAFFSRWKNLGATNNPQKCQRIFRASVPMEIQTVRTKLIGFGMALMDNIDPNPENFVCAGIIHTRTAQIGCLLRLEPNKQAQMYRLTVRSSKEEVSSEICDLLLNQF
ncbi:hypothetical protein WDU94_011815 [Cyamophila willieti]